MYLCLQIEGMEVVIICEFCAYRNVPQGKQSDSVHPVDIPLLHLTVGFTGVVYKSSYIPHSVSVYHHATVQVQAVVMTLIRVLLHHAPPELTLANHLTKIFQDETP